MVLILTVLLNLADDSSTVTSISANGETIRILGGTGITQLFLVMI